MANILGLDIDPSKLLEVGILGDYLQNEKPHEWYEVGVLLCKLVHQPICTIATYNYRLNFTVKLDNPYYMHIQFQESRFQYALELDYWCTIKNGEWGYDKRVSPSFKIFFVGYCGDFDLLYKLVERSYSRVDKDRILAYIRKHNENSKKG